MCRILVAKHPQRYHYDKESKDMTDQTGCFQLWEEGSAPGVEGNGNDDDGPHEEGDLPGCEGKIRHGNVDAGLDLVCHSVATAGETREPSQGCHPARGVGEDFLVAGRRKLADPICSGQPHARGEQLSHLRYCPPEVGAMEAISARLATTAEYAVVVATKHQNTPA